AFLDRLIRENVTRVKLEPLVYAWHAFVICIAVISQWRCILRQKIRSLIRKIRTLEQELELSFEPRPTLYCGLCFTKRPWYLLHGSHPPHLTANVQFVSFGGTRA